MACQNIGDQMEVPDIFPVTDLWAVSRVPYDTSMHTENKTAAVAETARCDLRAMRATHADCGFSRKPVKPSSLCNVLVENIEHIKEQERINHYIPGSSIDARIAEIQCQLTVKQGLQSGILQNRLAKLQVIPSVDVQTLMKRCLYHLCCEYIGYEQKETNATCKWQRELLLKDILAAWAYIRTQEATKPSQSQQLGDALPTPFETAIRKTLEPIRAYTGAESFEEIRMRLLRVVMERKKPCAECPRCARLQPRKKSGDTTAAPASSLKSNENDRAFIESRSNYVAHRTAVPQEGELDTSQATWKRRRIGIATPRNGLSADDTLHHIRSATDPIFGEDEIFSLKLSGVENEHVIPCNP
eukprot:m.132912 g.132912  ORF g.132912 m.132912 type:complete len:357 (-) comp17512_c0_seq2:124-1194(-)